MNARRFARKHLLPASFWVFIAVVVLAAGPTIPIIVGIGGFGAAIAEAHHWWNGPRSDDPRTIDEAAQRARAMANRGASNAQIAEWLSGVSDRRLTNANSPEGAIFLYSSVTPGDRQARFERHGSDREYHGMTPSQYSRQIHPSDATEQARWAWDLGVGNCNEHRSISYYVLIRAGLSPRLVQSSAGHDFTVFGLAPGAVIGDPSTWGPNARVVDGWRGRAYTAAEAAASGWHFGGGRYRMTDETDTYGSPALDRDYEAMEGKGLLKATVVRKTDHHAIAGVVVTAGGVSAVTSGQGTATLKLPVGEYTVTAAPTTNSGLTTATVRVEIEERAIAAVTLSLDRKTAAPAEPSRPPSPPSAATGVFRGSGSTAYPPIEASSNVSVRQNGSVTLDLTVDLDHGSFRAGLAGSMSATLTLPDGSRESLDSRMSGEFRGAWSGDVEAGHGTARTSLTETAMGISASGAATLNCDSRNGVVTCRIRLDQDGRTMVIRVPLR